MRRSSFNTSASSGVSASGIFRATVVSVGDDDLLQVKIPKLGLNNVYEGVSYAGPTPAAGDLVFVGFLEGKSGSFVAFTGVADSGNTGDPAGDITSVVAGTNLNGGGSSGNVTLNLDDDITIDSLQFDITANTAVETEGLLAWNEDWGTVDIGLHGSNAVLRVGQQVYYYAKNQTGSQIDKGTVVRFDGALGASGHLKMAPFLADGTYPSEYIMGVTAHDIPNGDDGYVVHFGAVRGIDTETPNWNAGDLLYVSSTVTGGLTSTAPSAPNNIILVAAVVNRHLQNGELFVRPTLSANILNDEAILYTSLSDNDTLVYNSALGAFENTSFDHGNLTGLGDDDHTQYLLVDGSRAADTFTVTGDLAVDTDTLFVDASTDRVGIGDSTPSYTLDVNGTGRFTGELTLDGNLTGTSNTNFFVGNDSNERILFQESSNQIFFMTNNTYRGYFTSGGDFVPYADNTYDLGSTSLHWAQVHAERYYTEDTDTYIEYDGDSGAGIDGPGIRFVINNSEMFKFLRENNDSNHSMLTFGENNDGILYEKDAEQFTFYRGSASIARFGDSGTGLSGAGGRAFSVKANGAHEMYRTSTGAADGILALYSNHGSTADLQWLVYGDGDTASDTGVYGTISDNRLKTNIVAYKDPTDDLMAINVIKYDLSKTSTGIDDNGDPIIVDRDEATTMTGWDAQQVQDIKPGFVKLDAERGILSVKSSVFVPLLHRGFQVHEEKIAALEARIAALEAE